MASLPPLGALESRAAPHPGVDRPLEALQRRALFGMTLGLERVHETLARLGDPHRGFQVVHVAGTNGKGSVSAMVESIARHAGLRTGLYTSPHLCRFAERIRLGGEPLGDAALDGVLEAVLAEGPADLTFFEVLTVAAFLAFERAGVDVVVLEVGLGGRLDATNVVAAPLVTAVTSIGLDHTAVLGGTVAEITAEKAGIFKAGSPVVLGPLDAVASGVALATARRVGSGPITTVRRGGGSGDAAAEGEVLVREEGERVALVGPFGSVTARVGLRGPHQSENAAVAAAAAWQLGARWPSVHTALVEGLAAVRWPGRFERLAWDDLRLASGGRLPGAPPGVTVLLDCAHNPAGAQALAAALAAEGIGAARAALVFGALADKAWRPMLEALSAVARRRYYTCPKGRAPTPPAELAAVAEGVAVEAPCDALALALAESAPGAIVVVAGSSYLVGELRAWLLGIQADPLIAL